MTHIEMLSQKRTFAFVSSTIFLLAIVIDCISCQTEDSYLIGIHQQKSKWAKKDVISDACGGIFREKQVLIRSPHFPNPYPKNLHCDYMFYSPFVCAVEFHIQFLHFDLEPSLSCSKDRLIIGHDEVLCGQVVGIMKYKAMNGSLKIQFISDQTIEKVGFELLITRLPCQTGQPEDGESKDLPVSVSLTVDSNWIPKQNRIEPIAKQSKAIAPNRSPESRSETTFMKPVCVQKSETQSNGIWPNSFPPIAPAVPPLPSCCINVYNQQTFYLISPDFPRVSDSFNDCLFHVERFHPNACRLRIEFQYFLLGDLSQPNQCTPHSYLEIDGQRFCGCRTGTVYQTQWGKSPYFSMRFVNLRPYQPHAIQGFILKITQEPCPYRLRSLQLVSTQNYQAHANDPRLCSYNYLSWLHINSNEALLAQSICVRNFG